MRSDDEVARMVGEGCPNDDPPEEPFVATEVEKAVVLLILGGTYFRPQPDGTLVPALAPVVSIPLSAIERLERLNIVKLRSKARFTYGLTAPHGVEFAHKLYADMVKGA